MKNKLLLMPVFLLAVLSASGCSSNDEAEYVLRVLNSADYIYEAETEEDDPDMMDQFVTYMEEEKGIKVSYVYDTFDTNETCYNELMTGKSSYDIVCVSDYMVQKMISSNLVQPLYEESIEEDERLEEIYGNVSEFLWDKFENIHPKDKVTNEYMSVSIDQYSVPYMWGTVGVMYNPSFYEDLEEDDVIEMFNSWEALYLEETNNSFSIKDSVRDVYAVSILHAYYESDILPLEEKLEKGEITEAEFNSKLNEIFNRCDDEAIAKVKEDMLSLKANSFGFEVDSGKTDMVEGKIGANLAWSGDATWAIFEAQSDYETELYFSVPDEGSNIWFDAFCIPNTCGNKDIAIDFLNFMSMPENAIQNMDYVGYTSAVAGDEVLDYVYELYDVRGEVGGDPLEEGEIYDISYFFEDRLTEYDISDAVLNAWRLDSEYVFVNEEEESEIPANVYARMLRSAFPRNEQLSHLVIMDDYGNRNEAVLDMWERVRTNALPLWAIIVFIIEAVVAAIAVAAFFIIKRTKKVLRMKRKGLKK